MVNKHSCLTLRCEILHVDALHEKKEITFHTLEELLPPSVVFAMHINRCCYEERLNILKLYKQLPDDSPALVPLLLCCCRETKLC